MKRVLSIMALGLLLAGTGCAHKKCHDKKQCSAKKEKCCKTKCDNKEKCKKGDHSKCKAGQCKVKKK
ncbi:MAG: hypothetical protein GY909_08060 [Oligoflexia bacterium]|nr:hypothetical protein [Oligoflexia bacterium]